MAEKTYKIQINSEKKIYRVFPPLARGSYVQSILEPQKYDEDSKPEWGCQLRWPLEVEETKLFARDMAKMFRLILTDKFGDEKAGRIMANPNIRIPLRNGDNELKEEFHGWLFMNVRNKFRQPVIMGPHARALPEDLINDSIIYSGAWYRCKLNFSHYENKGHGIGAYIEGLMKVKDDDRLDSGIDVAQVESEFEEFGDPDAGMDFGESDEADKIKGSDENGFDFL